MTILPKGVCIRDEGDWSDALKSASLTALAFHVTPQYAVPCVEDTVATLRDLLLVHSEDQLAIACAF